MFSIFSKKKKNLESIIIDDVGVRRTLANGNVECVIWDKLSKIKIITTDEGPIVDDVFWMLIQDEKNGCVIPSEYSEIDKLISYVQKLDGFNNSKMIESMTSTENKEFIVWEK